MGQWYTLLVVKHLEDSFFGFMQTVSFINGCKESASACRVVSLQLWSKLKYLNRWAAQKFCKSIYGPRWMMSTDFGSSLFFFFLPTIKKLFQFCVALWVFHQIITKLMAFLIALTTLLCKSFKPYLISLYFLGKWKIDSAIYLNMCKNTWKYST